MLLFSVNDTKNFMNHLFKDSFFNDYETRGVTLLTFTKFEISCHYEQTYYNSDSTDEDEMKAHKFCLWKEIHPTISSLIKGKRPPKLIKIIFCLSGDSAQKINENAATLFITVKYENGGVNALTGTSQKQFSLDKSVDNEWDNYVRQLFAKNGFSINDEAE